MTTVLVAGAGGYIGIPLCKRLIENGYQVVAFDRYYFGTHDVASSLSPLALSVHGDIRTISHSIVEQVDAVIDLAGLSNDPASMISPQLTRSINYDGACHLARIAKDVGIRRYIYMSSASVYGQSDGTSCETDPCHPQSLYAELKLSVEQALNEMRDDAFNPVIFRSATVFGLAARMRFDLVINRMSLMAVQRGRIEVDGNGLQNRPFIHVEDVGRAMLAVLEFDFDAVEQRIFNLGSDLLNYNIRSIAECVARLVPGADIAHNPTTQDSRDYRLSFARLKDILGFTPIRMVDDGVRDIVNYLRTPATPAPSPTCYTTEWYLSLMEWEERLDRIRINGQVLR
ncbi:NAD-dependent epimerase/dehydratase family protein [Agrobacterium rubi]|nr:SDR family oxidoreductase [Agrobacterium rubi]MCL6652679.1 oxidoreductase [Agrobacterium rubi]OCJ53457.1 oxidoreductase [Agrobacterium rubi]